MKNPPASVAHLDFVAGIPTLDLSHFTHGTAQQRQAFVDDLGAAYRSVGFAAISGHGVQPEVIDTMYAEAEAFFALPNSTKLKHEHPEHNRQRGYVSFGTEHAKDSKAADLKEFWQVGQTRIPEGADMDNYPPNAEVDECPRLAPQADALYQSLEDVGRQMLRAIALHLELEETYFEQFVPGGNSILRLIHYPPITGDPIHVRAGQHEDINLITLLGGRRPTDGGHDKEGEWTAVKALPEHLVVNVGDMLQRFDQPRAEVHHPPGRQSSARVVGQPRFSMPFSATLFRHEPRGIAQCVRTGESPLDPATTAGEYLAERLREIGLTQGK